MTTVKTLFLSKERGFLSCLLFLRIVSPPDPLLIRPGFHKGSNLRVNHIALQMIFLWLNLRLRAGQAGVCRYSAESKNLLISKGAWKMKKIVSGLLGMALLLEVCWAADKAELKNETDKINYSIGYQIGGDFKRQGLELNPETLVQGIRDALENSTPRISPEEMRATLVSLKKKLVAAQQSEKKQTEASFLLANAKKEGVTVLPDGVQYRVLRQGTGKKPTSHDSVSILYRVTSVDGREIGRTEPNAPKTYPVAKAIPGLQEVLPLMAEGSKWQIVIPSGLASGDRDPLDDAGLIIYDLELVSVQSGTK